MLMGGRGYLSLRYSYAEDGGVVDVPDTSRPLMKS